MKTVFVKLTGLVHDNPVIVNPNFVVAIEGSYLHLFGAGITVKEEHDVIVGLFAKALGYAAGSGDTDD